MNILKINHRFLQGAEPAIGMLLTCIRKTHQFLDAYMESPVKIVPESSCPSFPRNSCHQTKLSGPREAMVIWTEYWSLVVVVSESEHTCQAAIYFHHILGIYTSCPETCLRWTVLFLIFPFTSMPFLWAALYKRLGRQTLGMFNPCSFVPVI